MLGTQNCFRPLWVDRSSYIICEAQGKMKMLALVQKSLISLRGSRKALSRVWGPVWLDRSLTHDSSLHAVTLLLLSPTMGYVSDNEILLPKQSTGLSLLSSSNLFGDSISHQNSTWGRNGWCTGPPLLGPWNPGCFLSPHLSPSTQTNLWTPSSLGVWQPWLFSILLNIFCIGGASAHALRPSQLSLLKLS